MKKTHWVSPGARWRRLMRAWSIRTRRIARHVAAVVGGPTENLRKVDPADVRLAALQLPFQPAPTPEEYAGEMAGWAVRAAADGAQLIVFPEHSATALLGLFPEARSLIQGDDPAAAVSRVGEDPGPEDILRDVGPAVERAFIATFRAIARSLRVYVHAGTGMLPDRRGTVRNVAYLFGPDGRLVGRGVKAHLPLREAEWGLEPGEDLAVVDTLLGRIGLPVCTDVNYWETFRILYLRGVEIATLPTADPDDGDGWKVTRRLWSRVQESPMYGVQSCLVGRFLGIRLTGKSGIYGPYALSPRGDGIWARLEDGEAGGVITASVDVRRLHAFRASERFDESFNPALYSRYFPSVYERLARRRRDRLRRDPRSRRNRTRNAKT